MSEVPKIKLNNGTYIPALGLGTWQGPPGKEAEVGQAVKDAIDIGYRHFDCAHVYRNEKIIGDAIAQKIADGTAKREELFITSKLWNTYHHPDLVETALRETLKNLRLDYLDLYLVHWPVGYKAKNLKAPSLWSMYSMVKSTLQINENEGDDLFPKDAADKVIFSDMDYLDTWKAMEEVYKKGLTKSIGVSNFNSLQIDRLLKHAKMTPVINQVECHPYLNQKKLREFCLDRGIIITAYSPLGSPARPWQKPGDPDVINDAQIKQISDKYEKTPGQLLLRYQIQSGNSTVPKSSNKIRLAQNIDIFDFELSLEDMAFINTFNCNGRICPISDAKDHPFYPFQPHIEF